MDANSEKQRFVLIQLTLTVTQIKQRQTLQHIAIRLVGDCIDMRRHFMTLLALVQLNHLLRVDRQTLVWVDDHTEQSRVSLQYTQTPPY